MDIVAFLQANWAVIEAAPWTFVAIVVLIGGGGLFLGRFWRADIVTSMEGRLALKDDRIHEYERKLQGASPDEAAAKITDLERRLSALEPRSLSQGQQNRLVQALRQAPSAVSITIDGAAAESRQLHRQFVDAFNKAGWKVEVPMVLGVGNPPKSGVEITSRSPPGNHSPEAALIARAFEQCGIAFDLRASGGNPGQSVEILVTTPAARERQSA